MFQSCRVRTKTPPAIFIWNINFKQFFTFAVYLVAPVGSSGFLEGQGVRVCLRAKTIAEQRNESTQLQVHELTTTHATISAWRTEWPVLGQRPLKLDQAGANSSSPPCEYGVVHWIA